MKYYSKMPDDIAEREVIVIDAMLATGTSAIAAIKDLKEMGVKSIKFLCILACPEVVTLCWQRIRMLTSTAAAWTRA